MGRTTENVELMRTPLVYLIQIKNPNPRGFYGIDPVLLDENGKEIVGNPAKGNLCIRHPWPGLTRTIHNNHDRYFETYFKNFPGLYETGDAAMRDENGRLQIAGRMDDIINIGN